MSGTKPIRFAEDVIKRAEGLVQEVGELPEFYILETITRNDIIRLAVLWGLDMIEDRIEGQGL